MTTIIYGMPHGRVFNLHNGKSVYMETGKKSPGMPTAWDGHTMLPEIGIHEGEWVADLLFRYSEWLWDNDDELFKKVHMLFASAPEYPPMARVNAVNLLLPHIDDDVIYIEPHCNASGNEWSDAQGHIVFYNDAAKEYASILSACIGEHKAQDTGNRGIKLAPKGWTLDELKCPGMYSELFFMTNKYETEIAQDFLGMQGTYLAFSDFHRRVMK